MKKKYLANISFLCNKRKLLKKQKCLMFIIIGGHVNKDYFYQRKARNFTCHPEASPMIQ